MVTDTLSYWFRAGSGAESDCAIIGNTDLDNSHDMGLSMVYASSGIYATMLKGKRAMSMADNLMAVDGQWHHVVITVGDYGRTMETYIDGTDTNQSWDDTDSKAVRNQELPLVIGADGAFQYGLTDCLVDEVRIYSKPMDEDGVKALYTSEGYGVETGKMLAFLDSATPGARFSETQIAAMRAKVSAAQAQLAADGDPFQVMETLRADYLSFLEGNAPEGKVLVISDVHITDKTSPYNRFVTGLQDMKQVAPDAIAMLNAGDFSDYSKASQFRSFYKAMEEYSPVSPDKALIVMGNHDVRGESWWNDDPNYPEDCEEWPEIRERYLEMNRPYMPEGMDEDTLYFSKELGGYTFIALNTELGLKDVIYMNDAQLDWLEAEMAKAYEAHPDRPIFILCHQALNNTHPDTDTYLFCHEERDEDARVKEIMAKYPTGIFLSGHVHNGFGHGADMYREFGVAVDLPSYNVPEGRGYSKRGAGYVVYLYSDEVVFRARNFIAGEWLPQYDISIRLPDLAASYAQAKALQDSGAYAAVTAALTGTESMFSEENDPFYYQHTEIRAQMDEQRQLLLAVSALQTAYDAAKDVENSGYTDASWTAFENARAAALSLLNSSDGLVSTDAATAADTLTDAQKGLTKDSGSESPSPSPSPSGTPDAPVVPVIPENPSPSRPGDDTTTETKDNEDGTTTTIVTDNKTGTVTETTKKDDDTVEIVETRKDGTVTETTTDPEGGKVEKVTNPDKDVAITVTDKDGKELAKVSIPNQIPALDEDQKFVDVPDDNWAAEAINEMAALGVVNGKGNQIFDRKSPMKRSELAQVLYNMSNGKSGIASDFDDVAEGKWYADSVAWAASVGVVKGVGDNSFAPDRVITREELAVMLCRYANLLGMDITADTAALDGFNDGSNTHDWAADSIAWCVNNGILQGKGNGVLDPRADVTRAEVAVMLQRFVNLLGK